MSNNFRHDAIFDTDLPHEEVKARRELSHGLRLVSAPSGKVQGRRTGIRRLDSRRNVLPRVSNGAKLGPDKRAPQSRFGGYPERQRGRHRLDDGGFRFTNIRNSSPVKLCFRNIITPRLHEWEAFPIQIVSLSAWSTPNQQ
jgi:hypothetical protein